MPDKYTFDMLPAAQFVQRYLRGVSVDPSAGNKTIATYGNDLNPDAPCEYHMEAREFLKMCADKGVEAETTLFDPPYSPRQISECYKSIGREVGMKETQSAVLYSEARDILANIVKPDGFVLSFGWNSVGMGKGRGFELVEVLLICHGGAHNDTICIAEQKRLLF